MKQQEQIYFVVKLYFITYMYTQQHNLYLTKETFQYQKLHIMFNNYRQIRLFNTIMNGKLISLRYSREHLDFIIFDYQNQYVRKITQLKSTVLIETSKWKKGMTPFEDIFCQITRTPSQIISIVNDHLILKVQIRDQTTLILDMKLQQVNNSQKEVNNYLKDLYKLKEQLNKGQILKLKGKIYDLMVQIEDATNLIHSQSSLVKNCKEQTKAIKKQLQVAKLETKKPQKNLFFEIQVQYNISQLMNLPLKDCQKSQIDFCPSADSSFNLSEENITTEQINQCKKTLLHMNLADQYKIAQNLNYDFSIQKTGKALEVLKQSIVLKLEANQRLAHELCSLNDVKIISQRIDNQNIVIS